MPRKMAVACVKVGKRIQVEGHRGDYIMALAARANSALNRREVVEEEDLVVVAPLAMQHRRPGALLGEEEPWTKADSERVRDIISGKPVSAVGHAEAPGGEAAAMGNTYV